VECQFIENKSEKELLNKTNW